MGDFNSKVGEGKTSDAVGPFGLGERNKRGDSLELFASTHDLVVTNTWFKQPKRRLYTWKSPSDKPEKVIRNQIDFIMINKRFRNSCMTMRTYPGADILSDHNPLVGDFRIRMKKIKKKSPPPFDLRKLRYEKTKADVIRTLNDQYEGTDRGDVEMELKGLQKIVQNIKTDMLKPEKRRNKPWMTKEILELMEDRRLSRGSKEKKEQWTKYIEKLFQDNRAEGIPHEMGECGPHILEEEVNAAINQMKNGKAAGPNGIHAEFLKLLGTENIKRLTSIFNQIYTSGRIPESWLKSEFITLPKKPSAKTCDDYCTISLMSHVLKLFLKIIHKRIYKLCEEQIALNQFGFLNAVGTREALFSVQVLFQRSRDVNCSVFACLIDYKKAFDRVIHEKMVDILRNIGMDSGTINIIINLYWNQSVVLKIQGEHTEEINIQ
ncbi:uncharacterized protein LOC111043552 [Nilaparvata lugens]|uniref:uncharacterized protein LOC111043552 n=1 Tax=Nilaparvata lugens TaxID=108931 RepID=UPI000B99CD43|nr:uncharacterized protein LOC111043552 [Nilaparvata lugens]